MNGALIKTLVKAGMYLGISELLLKGKSSERRVRDVVIGIVLIILAGLVAFLVVAAVLAAIFFALSDQRDFVQPVVIVSLIAAVVTIALFWEGVRKIKSRVKSKPIRR